MNAQEYMDKHEDSVYAEIFAKMSARIGLQLKDIQLVKTGKTWEWPFYRYEWTEEEEADFKKWLIEYIYKHRKKLGCVYSKTIITSIVVPMFLLNYSWRYKEEKNDKK